MLQRISERRTNRIIFGAPSRPPRPRPRRIEMPISTQLAPIIPIPIAIPAPPQTVEAFLATQTFRCTHLRLSIRPEVCVKRQIKVEVIAFGEPISTADEYCQSGRCDQGCAVASAMAISNSAALSAGRAWGSKA